MKGERNHAATDETDASREQKRSSPVASTLEQVISLAKRRGFVYPCGEIYGGTRAAWDYGPLGVELKENIKKAWWNYMVRSREDVVGLDSSVILPPKVWEACLLYTSDAADE